VAATNARSSEARDGLWRVGVDTGGTFTDLVAVRDGEIRTAKVPSTPPDFDDGVLDALAAASIPPRDVVLLAHGTTATTNAVITKTGARTGLITTRGFRDVLELRRHNRGEIYDILWDPPEPLVARRFRLEVSERVDYAGKVVVPLAEDQVVASLDRLREDEIEALAVCFLHSYVNPAHELRVKEIAAERWPELYVSVSSDLLREPQEFERTSTVVANSYLGPILSTYVSRLEGRLAEQDFAGALLIMHSGGGLLPAQTAVAVPARTVTSGPAAGAMAAEGFAVSGAPAAGAMSAEALAAQTGVDQIISLDMGGTSADIAVIRDGRALLINEFAPEFGLPIRFPSVDLLTIGAGGGSIAWIDAAGAPQVGPQSAGARPGPACYGRGGVEPTVTDANLVLGRLSPEMGLAGSIRLDRGLAEKAVAGFAGRLELSPGEAALGIIEIANSNMAKAIRVMTVERGLDPRHFALLAFGGAGPMHACELAEQVGIASVLVPLAPGVTSALGTLFVDIVHDLARSYISPLGQLDVVAVEGILRELELEAEDALARDLVPPERRVLQRSLDLRYVGQLKTLSIPLPSEELSPAIMAAARPHFLREYERHYHYVTEEIDVELSVVRVRGRGLQDKPRLPQPPAGRSPVPRGSRGVGFRSAASETAVYTRSDLTPGTELVGPVVVEQLDSTTVVPPGWSLRADAHGNLSLASAPEGAGTP
jgi:N-methylhydantoinase A